MEITLQSCPRALLWLGHFAWVARVGTVFLRWLRPLPKTKLCRFRRATPGRRPDGGCPLPAQDLGGQLNPGSLPDNHHYLLIMQHNLGFHLFAVQQLCNLTFPLLRCTALPTSRRWDDSSQRTIAVPQVQTRHIYLQRTIIVPQTQTRPIYADIKRVCAGPMI